MSSENTSLFYTCALIEQIGRDLKMKRSEVVKALDYTGVKHIYNNSEVLHCEPIKKTADDFRRQYKLKRGRFDNITSAKYLVPDVWTIGNVYSRLIEDVDDGQDIVKTILSVYTSWIDEAISNYNSSFYYEPREYLAECYRAGEVLVS